MADLDDILGKKPKQQDYEIIDIDGSCEICYYWLEGAFYYPKEKKLLMRCVNGHEWKIDWEMDG